MTLHMPPSATGADPTRDATVSIVTPTPPGAYRRFIKRFLDVTLVLVSIVPVTILLTVLCALIALDGRTPLYFQKRVGRHGRIFNMWKLRSMVPNAGDQLEAYLESTPEARAEWELTQKLRYDPRITKIGAIIRKTSLDELPQLVNVLKGDMSLVGPRPMMVDQRTIYPGTAYFEMRPGITGMWQTSVRNESSFSERAIYDARYFREMSLMTDITLIARTFQVVAKGTGV